MNGAWLRGERRDTPLPQSPGGWEEGKGAQLLLFPKTLPLTKRRFALAQPLL